MIKTIVILISFSSYLPAQIISGLEYNHSVRNQLIKRTGFKSAAEILPFPSSSHLFFDDFSTYNNSVFPNSYLWTDRYAFINQTYPDSCISVGVATLDAFDDKGNVYAIDDSPTPSDTLTSKFIQTDTATGNVYLSFFIEGGGKGNAPGINDSIIVEFYIPDSARWDKMWYSLGYESHNFNQVIIPVNSIYKTDSFRFRFRNYTTLVKSSMPDEQEGSLGFSGLWHIDYIEVRSVENEDKMREVNDVAFTEPLRSTHYEYNSIPYNHFEVAISYREKTVPISLRTLFPNKTGDVTVYRNYETFNIFENKDIFQDGEYNIYNDLSFNTYISFLDDFKSAYNYYSNQKYGHYLLKSYLHVDDLDQYKYNDTLKREEIFKDYYAFDDGTAEYGFGLPGNGADGMRFAYMFNLYTFKTKDTLSAIDIYFPHSRNNAHKNAEYSICIWKSEFITDDSINPGELIYPKGESDTWVWHSPDTALEINEFTRVELTEDLIVSDTIFVGFVQKGNDFINIGFDINTNSRSRMRFNGGNGWITPVTSIPEGSLMIRPVFGHKVYNAINESTAFINKNLTIYPNPAKQNITLIPEGFAGDYENYKVSVYNVLGQNIFDREQLTNEMDISMLDAGMYIVRVLYLPSKLVFTQKFLKTE